MHIHLIAICGTGMGSLAGILKAAGHHVTGSDANVYPPMSTYLAGQGIPIFSDYEPVHLEPRPDLVVVGNAIRRDNPEARAAIDGGIEYTSFPGALRRFFLEDRTTVAVTGTHGKTTTTAMVAWIFTHAGLDPSFLVGGVARNLGSPVRLGAGRHFIVEGDEYDTAFFDKVPKFVRYRPDHAILANIEFDHADIYPDLDAVKRAFAMLVDGMPKDGTLVVGIDCPNVRERIASASCRVATYAIDREADYRASNIREESGRVAFDIIAPDGRAIDLEISMPGRHNALNALAAFAMSRVLGLDDAAIRAGLASFEGVKRRQEIRGEEAGVVVIDDFAHHPTAVRVTLEALRGRFAGRRIIVLFEPRTNTSRRAYFQELYSSAFDAASAVVIAPVFGAEALAPSERFDAHRLAADLRGRGIDACDMATYDETLDGAMDRLRPGDVAVLMSNGGFGGMHERLLDALRDRDANP